MTTAPAGLPTRNITLTAGLYHIEGVPVYLPETVGQVHTANAADLQKLIAKCGGMKSTEALEGERQVDDDFKAAVEGGFNHFGQHLQSQNAALAHLGETLKNLDGRLARIESGVRTNGGDPTPATVGSIGKNDESSESTEGKGEAVAATPDAPPAGGNSGGNHGRGGRR